MRKLAPLLLFATALLPALPARTASFDGDVIGIDLTLSLSGLPPLVYRRTGSPGSPLASPFDQFTSWVLPFQSPVATSAAFTASPALTSVELALGTSPAVAVTRGALGGPLPLALRMRGFGGLTLLSVPLHGLGTGSASGNGLTVTTQAGLWTSGVARVTTPSGAVLQSTGSRVEPDFSTPYNTTTFTDHDVGHIVLVKPIRVTSNLGDVWWAGFVRLRLDGFFYSTPEPSALALLALAGVLLAVGRRKQARA